MADLSEPYPDRAHEAIRTELLATIAAGQDNAAGVDDSYYLTDVLFELIDSLLAQLDAASTRADAQQAAVADLTARVEALELPLP